MGDKKGKKDGAPPGATAYLIAYNLASCCGWAYVWLQVARTVASGGSAAQFWQSTGKTLAAVQSLAALEIAHTALRLVRSPLLTVFMQVMSRLIVLWIYTWPSGKAHAHWSLLLMVGSWASVEVPRYLFYALNLLPQFAGSKMPFPLFWLRYSLFMLLYPSGITGELLQAYVSLTSHYSWDTAWQRFLFVFPLLVYPPASPFMIWNMWGNRVAQFKKRKAELSGAPPRKAEGVVWPVTDSETGERSTSVTNQSIWEHAVASADPELATAVRASKKWRFSYGKHVEKQVRCALRSKDNALQIARDGLARAHEAFEFVRGDETSTLAAAMDKYKGSYETGFVQGTGAREVTECTINYKGKALRGAALSKQLDLWVSEGVIEPSAGDAIKAVMASPKWVDLSDRHFVLLGATSAMGPLDLLLACGANIIGVDLDRPFIWDKLIGKARKSPGTLTFPLRRPQSELASDEQLFAAAGANLLTHTPEIANWLLGVCPGKPLTVGNYTYLDGALHVQLSVACDAIMQKVCAARPDTSLAFLCTPTDVHCIAADAYAAVKANWKARPAWQRALEQVMGRADLRSNVLEPAAGSGLFLTDGIAERQGPNYALAKRMQHWRCVLAREAGHTVSSNVAPSTSTASVTSNPLFAAAYEGFVLFKALEVMEPATSSSAMLALLINDLRNPDSVSNPRVPLDNPMQLFASNAFHGGSFRCPYKIGSIGTVSVLYFVLKHYGLVLLPVLGGMGYALRFVATGKR